jgi:hypothetical protein
MADIWVACHPIRYPRDCSLIAVTMTMASPNASAPSPEDWKPWVTKPFFAICLIILHILLSAGLLFTFILSERTGGLVNLEVDTFVLGGQQLQLAFFLRVLPSLVFTLFGLYWGSMEDAVAFRQPYVELNSRDGSSAKKTILLDYRHQFVLTRPWSALQNQHYVVLATTLASLALRFAPAISAALLIARPFQVSSEVGIQVHAEFDTMRINAHTDFSAVLDTISATKIYEGGSIHWTKEEYAFTPLRRSV